MAFVSITGTRSPRTLPSLGRRWRFLYEASPPRLVYRLPFPSFRHTTNYPSLPPFTSCLYTQYTSRDLPALSPSLPFPFVFSHSLVLFAECLPFLYESLPIFELSFPSLLCLIYTQLAKHFLPLSTTVRPLHRSQTSFITHVHTHTPPPTSL